MFHPGLAQTGREISRIDTFKKEWRIRTNLAKFSVIMFALPH